MSLIATNYKHAKCGWGKLISHDFTPNISNVKAVLVGMNGRKHSMCNEYDPHMQPQAPRRSFDTVSWNSDEFVVSVELQMS